LASGAIDSELKLLRRGVTTGASVEEVIEFGAAEAQLAAEADAGDAAGLDLVVEPSLLIFR
jgi:hypothetical protein